MRSVVTILGASLVALTACRNPDLPAGPGGDAPRAAVSIDAAPTTQNIAGTVTGITGKLVGIQVTAFDAFNAEPLGSALTVSDGTYDTGLMPIGSYRVRFSNPGGVSTGGLYGPEFAGAGGKDLFCVGAVVPVVASTTTILDEEMALSEPSEFVPIAGSIEGLVVDAANGTPIANIRVTVRGADNATPLAVLHTNDQGQYRVTLKDQLIGTAKVRFSDPAGAFLPVYYGKPAADLFCDGVAVAFAGGVEGIDASLNRAPPEHVTETLLETIESFTLPENIHAMLVTPLDRLIVLLTDANGGNDAAACGQLGAFLSRVAVQEQRGELTAEQAAQLSELTATLQSALGCP